MVVLTFMLVVLSLYMLVMRYVMDQTKKGEQFPFLEKIGKRFF